MYRMKKLLSTLLAFMMVAAYIVPSPFAAHAADNPEIPAGVLDHGYNWMHGIDSETVRAYGQDLGGNADSHSNPYCGWYENDPWFSTTKENWLFMSVSGLYYNAKGVVYTDVVLDLTNTVAPVFTFTGSLHANNVYGVNLTFLVDDGDKFWIAGSDRLHWQTEFGTPKFIEVDLSYWAGEEITFRILVSHMETEPDMNYGMLYDFKLMDGDELISGPKGWTSSKVGFLSFADLYILQGTDPIEPDDRWITAGLDDLGYNWIAGRKSAGINAIGTPSANVFEDGPYSVWTQWVPDGLAAKYGGWSVWLGVSGTLETGLPLPTGVVYTDIPLNLGGFDEPALLFDGNLRNFYYWGVNLSFFVDFNGVYGLAGTCEIDYETVKPVSGNTPGTAKAIRVDLSAWAGKSITLRIIASDRGEGKTPGNIAFLYNFTMLEGDSPTDYFDGYSWNSLNAGSGYISFVALEEHMNTQDFDPPDIPAGTMDWGYNWMHGMETAPVIAARQYVQDSFSQDSHSAPTCAWNDYDPYWGQPGEMLFASVSGMYYEPRGVVYADIPLNLAGISSPVFMFKGCVHTTGLDGVNLTFLVNDGTSFWIAGTNMIRGTDTLSRQKSINVDLTYWATKSITLRILISVTDMNNVNYAILRNFELLDGEAHVQGYSTWKTDSSFTTGFISYANLDVLQGNDSPQDVPVAITVPYFVQDWMHGLNIAKVDAVVEWDSSCFPDGAFWRWTEDSADPLLTSALVQSMAPRSPGYSEGIVIADIPLDLTLNSGDDDIEFSLWVKLANETVLQYWGVGIVIYVADPDTGEYIKVQGNHIRNYYNHFNLPTPDPNWVYATDATRNYLVTAELSQWAGKEITMRIGVDEGGWGQANLCTVSHLLLTCNGDRSADYDDWKNTIKTGYIHVDDATLLSLEANRPDNAIMDIHKDGLNADSWENVYSAVESYRPLLGTHFYFNETTRPSLPYMNDVIDFLASDYTIPTAVELEMAGIPWVGVIQTAVPLGSSDKANTDKIDALSGLLDATLKNYAFNLGMTTGSEPQIAPGYVGGQTQQDVDNMGKNGASAKEFGEWIGSIYGTANPSAMDSRGNSFEKDFGYTTNSWAELYIDPAIDIDGYLLSTFKEHAISEAIIYAQQVYENTVGLRFSSRLLSPQYEDKFGQSIRQLQLLSSAVGVTYYPWSSERIVYGTGSTTKHLYQPTVTEFRGSLLYNIAQANGLRIVYNEYCTNDAFGSPAPSLANRNNPGNFYRGIFGELQYKPSVINWFAYTGTTGSFQNHDMYPIITEMAVLRSQLELSRIYDGINRERRELAVFVPDAAPGPVSREIASYTDGNLDGYERLLEGQLMQYGPDVFPINTLKDNYSKYENIIIVLGYIDGATDTFLSQFLSNIPENTQVMVMASGSELYCEPGGRTSVNFRRSLQEFLPVSPNGDGTRNLAITLLNTALQLRVAQSVYINKAFAAAGTLYNDIAWLADDNTLMTLAGIPTTGLDSLISQFFGIHIPDMRESGNLKLLNRDVTATEPGWYSVDRGQTLTIGEGLVGYDLTTRQPVTTSFTGDSVNDGAVIRVIDKKEFVVIDAGVGTVHLLNLCRDEVTVIAKKGYHPDFRTGANSEFIIYSPIAPTAFRAGEDLTARISSYGDTDGFYVLAIDNEEFMTYIITAELWEPEPTVIGVSAVAVVTKLNGNENHLTIIVTESFSDGSLAIYTEIFLIDNNSASIYQVCDYKVYVDTKGNDHIRACYVLP